MSKRFSWLLILLLLVAPPALAGALEDSLAAQLQLAASNAATEDETQTVTVLAGFYRSRQMGPLWVTEAGASERAKELSRLLTDAHLDALDPAGDSRQIGAGAGDQRRQSADRLGPGKGIENILGTE